MKYKLQCKKDYNQQLFNFIKGKTYEFDDDYFFTIFEYKKENTDYISTLPITNVSLNEYFYTKVQSERKEKLKKINERRI